LLASALIASARAQPADATPTADEKKAIALVAKAGGKAEIDPKLPEAARVSAKFESASDAALVSLKKAPQLGALDVYDATRCTEKGFAALKELPNLRKLSLGKSAMTLPRAKAIGQCKELRRLYLAGCGLTDAQLAALKPLTLLEWLDVSDNPITDKGMATVKALERLQQLYLDKTGITDRGLMELKGLDGLRRLSVGDTKVTADAAEKFADEMPNLRGVRR
jgi:Leucine-rich repeat (LRR) protein